MNRNARRALASVIAASGLIVPSGAAFPKPALIGLERKIIKPTLADHLMLAMPLLTTGAGAFPAAAAAGSAWGDHGTNVTLSTTTIANDTATGVANSFSTVRGAQAYSSGKHYFEVKFLVAPAVANLYVGLMDNATANGAAMDDRLLANSGAHLKFNGQGGGNGIGFTGLVNLGSAWALANNDVMAIAVDHTNGFWYLGLGTPPGALVWFLSGDPTSGATGTGHVGSDAMAGARPMLTLWGTPANSGTAQLLTSTFTYTPPTGYSAWG